MERYVYTLLFHIVDTYDVGTVSRAVFILQANLISFSHVIFLRTDQIISDQIGFVLFVAVVTIYANDKHE